MCIVCDKIRNLKSFVDFPSRICHVFYVDFLHEENWGHVLLRMFVCCLYLHGALFSFSCYIWFDRRKKKKELRKTNPMLVFGTVLLVLERHVVLRDYIKLIRICFNWRNEIYCLQNRIPQRLLWMLDKLNFETCNLFATLCELLLGRIF